MDPRRAASDRGPHRWGSGPWRPFRPLSRLLPCFILLAAALCRPAAPAEERRPLLDEALRPGWSVETTGELTASVQDGTLEVRPTAATRGNASVLLAAGPKAEVDARADAYLTFEINTLPGAGGAHRAPQLRLSAADASGRSREPLLRRYVQLDTDPGTWQQVVAPLRDLLDRDTRADALARVGWQFALFPAPFAVRRVALLGKGEAPGAGPAAANLVADPSFEARADARPVWSLVGDYRDSAAPGERSIETGIAAHGKRFLRLHGPNAYFFEALSPRANAVGFAAAVRAPQAAKLELGCEIVVFGLRGGIAVAGRAVRRVDADSMWRRFALSAAAEPEDLPAEESGLRLYRAWMRPLGTAATVDVDAVSLAPGPVDANAFEEVRANPLAEREGVYRQVRALMDARSRSPEVDRGTPAGLQSELPPLRVPLEVREWAGRQWGADTIVSGGIPLARGTVYSPDALRIRDAEGRDVPFQFEVLRRDPRDGSARVLWLAFPATPGPGRRLAFTLESGAATAPAGAPIVSETPDAVLLDTGALRVRLPRDRFPLFAEAAWPDTVLGGTQGAIRVQTLDGRELTSAGAPSQIAVERNGPLCAVVRVRGALTAVDGRPGPRFLYDARLRAWRGQPGLQVDVAVTNLTPEPAVAVRSLALVVPAARVRRVDGAIGREGAEPVSAPLRWDTDFIRLTQRRDPFREGKEDLLTEVFEQPSAVEPGRADGWARWQPAGRTPVFLLYREMARRHPAALEVGAESLSAYLVPPAGAKAFDIPFGMTAYGEFWVGAGEAPALIRDRMERPPLLSAAPEHVARSGLVRPFLLPEEMAKRYPLLDALLGRETRLWLGETERLGTTGWLNDGDTGSFGLWQHGDGDGLAGLYLAYLRGGDPAVWQRARRQAVHLREIGTWWANEESAFQHPGGGIHTSYVLDPFRFRVTGLLYDYWLTGDRRSLDVADALGAEMLALSGTMRYGGPEGAHLLEQLAELYGATGRRVYRETYERHLAAGAPGGIEAGAGSLSVAALGRGLQCLESPLVPPRFGQRLAQLGEWLTGHPTTTSLDDPGGASLCAALSFAPSDGLPVAAWQSALNHILWLHLAPYARDPILYRASQALAAASGARSTGPSRAAPGGRGSSLLARDLDEAPGPALAFSGAALNDSGPSEAAPSLPGWARGTLLGIGPYSGGKRTFAVRIARRGNEPIQVTLCRMRAETPDLSRLYRVRVQLRDPLDHVVREEVLQGNTFEAHPFSLPGVGVTGDYLLLLACEEDGLVDVLSEHPRVFVRADEWKASRYPMGRALFYLRGPKGGEVRLALRGAAQPSGDSTLGATLRGPAGEPLGTFRWSPPLTGTDLDGTPPVRTYPAETLRLAIPAALRGKPLSLEITSPAGVEWRIEGLDEPWLAASPEAFGS